MLNEWVGVPTLRTDPEMEHNTRRKEQETWQKRQANQTPAHNKPAGQWKAGDKKWYQHQDHVYYLQRVCWPVLKGINCLIPNPVLLPGSCPCHEKSVSLRRVYHPNLHVLSNLQARPENNGDRHALTRHWSPKESSLLFFISIFQVSRQWTISKTMNPLT